MRWIDGGIMFAAAAALATPAAAQYATAPEASRLTAATAGLAERQAELHASVAQLA